MWYNYLIKKIISEGAATMKKKLYKSQTDKKLCGVCGGIAEWLGIDSTIVRLIWVILTFCFGLSIFAYIIAALIMPNEPDYFDKT